MAVLTPNTRAHTDRKTHTHTQAQTDRQTDTHTHTHTHTHTSDTRGSRGPDSSVVTGDDIGPVDDVAVVTDVLGEGPARVRRRRLAHGVGNKSGVWARHR